MHGFVCTVGWIVVAVIVVGAAVVGYLLVWTVASVLWERRVKDRT